MARSGYWASRLLCPKPSMQPPHNFTSTCTGRVSFCAQSTRSPTRCKCGRLELALRPRRLRWPAAADGHCHRSFSVAPRRSHPPPLQPPRMHEPGLARLQPYLCSRSCTDPPRSTPAQHRTLWLPSAGPSRCFRIYMCVERGHGCICPHGGGARAPAAHSADGCDHPADPHCVRKWCGSRRATAAATGCCDLVGAVLVDRHAAAQQTGASVLARLQLLHVFGGRPQGSSVHHHRATAGSYLARNCGYERQQVAAADR